MRWHRVLGGIAGASLTGSAGWWGGLSAAEAGALTVIVLMALWWLTEAIPYYVTALVPALSIPLLEGLGVSDAGWLWQAYGQPVIGLFLGSFWLAKAIEVHQVATYLQKRILQRSGGDARRLFTGIMGLATLLSMLLNNTAVTALLLPLVPRLYPEGEERWRLALAIAWASSVGGVLTLTGSAPNGITAQFLENHGHPVSYLRWLMYGFPAGAGILGIAWLFLRPSVRTARVSVSDSPANLAPAGRLTLGVIATTVIGWLFVPLPAWSVSLLGGMSLFILSAEGRPLLSLKEGQQIPWGILWLFGGGLALSRLMELSGLTERFARWSLELAGGVPPILLLMPVMAITLWLTELLSNTALIALILPVIYPVVAAAGLSPYKLVLVGISVSMAFMLPVATPPNALAHAVGGVPLSFMRRRGFWLNWLALSWLSLLSLVLD